MPKILKPYTIIPSNLYVHRDADRQVRNLITDMGRPGYVLVSRQMGKTNLLLNAKRELESFEDVFVYIDLSNPFESPRESFENIIDTAIETNEERFKDAKKKILEQRVYLVDTPAHKQHSNELRILLNSITGRLVIILDEIDALTKTSYSDQIFAQIRSIYFSRVNFEELSRLTYLLSGVIEPTEIIKDSKISPFNIGQKIFLNDFSQEEFNLFLEKAELSLTDSTKDRIFHWTNGNPRMTWDVCSAVENTIKQEAVGPETVDKIVLDTYLSSFDKPPIDTIRELVRQDREIRVALADLDVTKGKGISDKVRNKLYLAGIINYEENTIQVKNNVIRRCLDKDWLHSLEIEDRGLFEVALNLINRREYQKSISTFEQFLESSNVTEEKRSSSYFNMAHAALQLLDIDRALEYSDKVAFDRSEEPAVYYNHRIQKGLIHYYLSNTERSLAYFKEVIDSGRKDELYLRAIINFGSISLSSDLQSHKESATVTFDKIIREIDTETKGLSEAFKQNIKTIAYHNLAQILKSNNDEGGAKGYLNIALENSDDTSMPIIALRLLDLQGDREEKAKLVEKIATPIISGKIKPHDPNPELPLDFTFNDLLEVFLYAYEYSPDRIFAKLAQKIDLLGDRKYADHLYEIAIFAINTQRAETGLKILDDIYLHRDDQKYEASERVLYRTLKYRAFFSDSSDSSVLFDYVSEFRTARLTPIDYFDFVIFSNLIVELTEAKKFDEALSLVALIKSVKGEIPPEVLLNYIVILHLELNILRANGGPELLSKAKEAIEFANKDEFKLQQSSLLGETGLDLIKQYALADLRPRRPRGFPAKTDKVYGRNEVVKVRYPDGRILEAKYKKVETAIKRGDCFVMDNKS